MINFNDEIEEIDNYTDYELVDSFHNMLSGAATGGKFDDKLYKYMRNKIVQTKTFEKLLPSWVKTNRDIGQFWSFIKLKFGTYAERREFLKNEFSPLLDFLEFNNELPIDNHIKFDELYIHEQWKKAIERKSNDPEGAITIARTLIESVLKYILSEQNISFSASADLSELYKAVAKSLNLAPEQHQESIFKQILGGSSAIVNGLGQMRNKLGDSHGTNGLNIKPKERHSELAVNLAGTMAIFLFKTYKEIHVSN
ncbi:abortive infection family protein [Aliarcobacter skirrowii]|uniref:abortive infection family protein n=1 Tax=Aliarcobacter skirrowii TaxID=28200 RepID=UPI0029B203E7|nr:abortive infection family protein [Aliarcobacter skirrowii]MDX4047698.1 abortive infection family protein [Aliarcobacter skirrowii]